MLTPDFTFHHTVAVRPFIERDVRGNVYGPTSIYRCRVDINRKQAHSGTMPVSEQRAASGTVFMAAGTQIPLGSVMGYGGHDYTVVEVRHCSDGFSGRENHVEVIIE